jgi:hypothetical protein
MEFELIITVFVICSCIGMSAAEEIPGYVLFLQGAGSSITGGEDGASILTISGMIPYGVLLTEQNTIAPVDFFILYMNKTMNAAIVLSGSGGETTSFVTIEDASYSNKSGVLTLSVQPVESYEGSGLKKFDRNTKDLASALENNSSLTRVYLEFDVIVPANDRGLGYSFCKFGCDMLASICFAGGTTGPGPIPRQTPMEICQGVRCDCYKGKCKSGC